MPIDWFNRLALFLAGVLGARGRRGGLRHGPGGLQGVSPPPDPRQLAFGLVSPTSTGLRAGALVVGLGALSSLPTSPSATSRAAFFPYAAPIGGTAMIAGWAIIRVAGLLRRAGP